eukprot:PDM82230.1 hypothetical protein PRIPAC_36623 [Pristionchus pacificus]
MKDWRRIKRSKSSRQGDRKSVTDKRGTSDLRGAKVNAHVAPLSVRGGGGEEEPTDPEGRGEAMVTSLHSA